MEKSVEIALQKGIIKSKNLIVDSTHTLSRYNNLRPHEVLQQQAKELRKAVYSNDETMKELMPAKVTGDKIEDHIKYCENLLEVVESNPQVAVRENVILASNYLREMLDDNLEHLQTSPDDWCQ